MSSVPSVMFSAAFPIRFPSTPAAPVAKSRSAVSDAICMKGGRRRRDEMHDRAREDGRDGHRPDRGGSGRAHLRPRGENQAKLVRLLLDESTPIVVCSGPAGCGKTHVAVSVAIERLMRGEFERVVLVRPAVGAFEEHGFLPGGIDEKMEPWVRPMIDVAEETSSPAAVRAMRTQGRIEAAPLAYMRGRTFKRTFAILDESQDALPEQVFMFLSRIGEGSKFVVTGDPAQSDRGRSRNGLDDLFARIVRTMPDGIGSVRFDGGDVQRHTVIPEILRMYSPDSGVGR